jgi:hypothetical protein
LRCHHQQLKQLTTLLNLSYDVTDHAAVINTHNESQSLTQSSTVQTGPVFVRDILVNLLIS